MGYKRQWKRREAEYIEMTKQKMKRSLTKEHTKKRQKNLSYVVASLQYEYIHNVCQTCVFDFIISSI